jgi:hypothetical protein
MNNSFESYFLDLIKKDRTSKFVILLGSGFHKQAYRNNSNINNCLSSWCCLLKEIEPNLDLSNNFLLDFERIILNNTNQQDEKAAFKIENEILKEVVTIINNYQNETIKNGNVIYPLSILNSEYVSDVISLNFDLIPELLLKNNRKTKVQNLHEHKNKKSIIHSTRYRVINGINFWHPHGDIDKYDSLILGTRKYGLHINKIEELRERSKQKKKPENYQKSWYDVLTHNPVIILGADISDMEWDIWSAIVNRERNFGKKENSKKHKFPIFQMITLSSENKTKAKSNEIWFNPLFDENLSFEEQWNKLEKLFNNEK